MMNANRKPLAGNGNAQQEKLDLPIAAAPFAGGDGLHLVEDPRAGRNGRLNLVGGPGVRLQRWTFLLHPARTVPRT